MQDERLYGIAALFDSPDKVLLASKEIAESGYKDFDVYTPYPLHGMDSAMKLKQSKVGVVTLISGMIGVVSALLFMWWTNSVDYPLLIGGKPLFALPDYIPITFELGVLFGSVSTVIGLLIIFLNLPRNSHPLHDTGFMKRVSSDKFGICIESTDPLFDANSISERLEKLGAESVEEIYYKPEQISLHQAILDPKFIGAIILVALVSSGATYFTLNELLFMRPWTSLNNQNKVLPETRSTFYADGFAMRPPVEGTVARGQLPYFFGANDMKAAENYMVNPLLPTKRVLETGQRDYNIYCSPCHGYQGNGDSRLRGQFPNPPTFHSDTLRKAPDGHFYQVITDGFMGIMPSYARQIPPDERWAIVWYIRALQKSHNVKG
ncbi:MAG: quinol:electron acceptor oxidoreductase subunit ActD [Candidatus Kryptoniota bacterium]